MADFSVYGTIYNQTYYNLPAPTTATPDHGYWKTSPGSMKAGKNSNTTYQLADNAGCNGAQSSFHSSTRQMDYKWAICDPYSGSNYVTPYSLSEAVVTWYQAKTDGSYQKNSTPPSGHPLYVEHYVLHNPAYLLPYGTQQQQGKGLWCWAAVTSMLTSYYIYSGSSAQCSQCAVVTAILLKRNPNAPLTDCCNKNTPTEICDTSASDPEIVWSLGQLGVEATLTSATPSFASLQASLDNMQPCIIGITWFGQVTGHVAIINGYEVDSGTKYLSVYDPGYGIIRATYDTIMNNYQSAGYVDAWFQTSYPQPWTLSKAPRGLKRVPIPDPFQPENMTCQDLLVARLPPTAQALKNPMSSAKIFHARFQTVGAPADGVQRLVIFEQESDKIGMIHQDVEFVRSLQRVARRAQAEADKQKTLHEIAYLPLPFLRVDAVVVFNPKNRRPKTVFVVPKIYETELTSRSSYPAAFFLKNMQKRFEKIQKLPKGQRR